MDDSQPKPGQIRVTHYPQVPCKGFDVLVDSMEDAVKLVDVLAYYDMFQLVERIKPDYANSTYIERYTEYEEDGKTLHSWDVVEDYEEDYVQACANVEASSFAIEDADGIQTKLKEMDL